MTRSQQNDDEIGEIARVKSLPQFSLIEVCAAGEVGAVKREITCPSTGEIHSYYHKPVAHIENPELRVEFNRFPAVIAADGTIWQEANLFLLGRLKKKGHSDTEAEVKVARDLVAYRRFLDEDGIAFDKFPVEEHLRPTYRFSAHLDRLVLTSKISLTLARRQINSVVAMYRWLALSVKMVFENPPWENVYLKFSTANQIGLQKNINVVSTDLRIKGSSGEPPYKDTISTDDGELRPLPYSEQLEVLEALNEIGSVEMTLIFYVALFTGARLQTVLTLRIEAFVLSNVSARPEVAIPVGPGTGVDTKHSKQIVLFFPMWLYRRLALYAASERASKRRIRCSSDAERNRMFLTPKAEPYYDSKIFMKQFNPSNKKSRAKKGEAVGEFLRKTLLPLLRQRLGPRFSFRFHDLRASFGMNQTDSQLALVERGVLSLSKARQYVKARMGHSNSTDTDIYLNYRQNLKISMAQQDAYEEFIANLAGIAGEMSGG